MRMPDRLCLESLIADALFAADPHGYAEAGADGSLASVNADRVEFAIQTYHQLMADGEPRTELLASLGEQLREGQAVGRAAVEVALRQATEF